MNYKIHTIDVQNSLQNYIWVLEHQPSQQVIVVDPTDAQLVQQYCEAHALQLKQIWLTHWHKDHIGGVPELLKQYPEVAIYGPAAEREKIPFLTHPLHDLDQLNFHDLQVEILAVPGHTLGHIVYFIPHIQTLFCGDTLFAMGCGRVFEGTFAQMYASLQRLAALPGNTQVYCTHEYSLANAQFAVHVEPENEAIQQRAQHIQQQREQGQCTLPSQIQLELETNPFLRAPNVSRFQTLRELKDQF